MTQQEPITLTIQSPDEIDGNPAQVARVALDQLDAIAGALGPVIESTARQVKNAVHDEMAAEEVDPGVIAEQLLDWEGCPDGQRLATLEKVGVLLPRLAAAARRAL